MVATVPIAAHRPTAAHAAAVRLTVAHAAVAAAHRPMAVHAAVAAAAPLAAAHTAVAVVVAMVDHRVAEDIVANRSNSTHAHSATFISVS